LSIRTGNPGALPLSLGRLPFSDYTANVRTNFHRFLLIVLMLILPLQAFASASMLGCMLVPVPAQVDAEPMLTAGCHESEQPDSTPTPHNCKHCAICALATALPIPHGASLALVPTTLRFMMQPEAPFSGFIPDSPERPPRLSLV
jgi:hypothetical protein